VVLDRHEKSPKPAAGDKEGKASPKSKAGKKRKADEGQEKDAGKTKQKDGGKAKDKDKTKEKEAGKPKKKAKTEAVDSNIQQYTAGKDKSVDENKDPESESKSKAAEPQKPKVDLTKLYEYTVAEWLAGLAAENCEQYAEKFVAQGYDDMKFMCERELDDEDLQAIGIEAGPQMTAIKESLRKFQINHYRPMMLLRGQAIQS